MQNKQVTSSWLDEWDGYYFHFSLGQGYIRQTTMNQQIFMGLFRFLAALDMTELAK